MTSSHLTTAPCQWFSWLAAALDRRSALRLALLFLGAVLARGRRTVTTRIRAAKLSDRYQSCYIAVAAAGKRADRIALRQWLRLRRPRDPCHPQGVGQDRPAAALPTLRPQEGPAGRLPEAPT